MSDRQPREEALRTDPAFLEKYKVSETTVRAVSEHRIGRVMLSKSPVNPGKEVPVVAGRSVGM